MATIMTNIKKSTLNYPKLLIWFLLPKKQSNDNVMMSLHAQLKSWIPSYSKIEKCFESKTLLYFVHINQEAQKNLHVSKNSHYSIWIWSDMSNMWLPDYMLIRWLCGLGVDCIFYDLQIFDPIYIDFLKFYNEFNLKPTNLH